MEGLQMNKWDTDNTYPESNEVWGSVLKSKAIESDACISIMLNSQVDEPFNVHNPSTVGITDMLVKGPVEDRHDVEKILLLILLKLNDDGKKEEM